MAGIHADTERWEVGGGRWEGSARTIPLYEIGQIGDNCWFANAEQVKWRNGTLLYFYNFSSMPSLWTIWHTVDSWRPILFALWLSFERRRPLCHWVPLQRIAAIWFTVVHHRWWRCICAKPLLEYFPCCHRSPKLQFQKLAFLWWVMSLGFGAVFLLAMVDLLVSVMDTRPWLMFADGLSLYNSHAHYTLLYSYHSLHYALCVSQ